MVTETKFIAVLKLSAGVIASRLLLSRRNAIEICHKVDEKIRFNLLQINENVLLKHWRLAMQRNIFQKANDKLKRFPRLHRAVLYSHFAQIIIHTDFGKYCYGFFCKHLNHNPLLQSGHLH